MNQKIQERQFLIQMEKGLESICRQLFEFYGSCDDCLHPICCTAASPSLLPSEMERISQHLKMSEGKFKKKFIVKLNLPKVRKRLIEPCPFLIENHCSIYNKRPKACRTFPFESAIMLGCVRLESITMCPIATQISDEFNDFMDEYGNLNPETDESKEFSKEMELANEEIQKRISDSVGIDDSHENWYMMTSILFFVCFYELKIKKISNVRDRFKEFQLHPESIIEALLSEGSVKSKEPEFLMSKKTIDECMEKIGKKPPKFKDVKELNHDKYLEGIKTPNALLICMAKPSYEFPDNLQGECAECKCQIYYRPYNQDATKKVCESCGIKLIEMERND